MEYRVVTAQEGRVRRWGFPRLIVWPLIATVLLHGCSHDPTDLSQRPEIGGQKIIVLREITAAQGKAFLDDLDLGKISLLPNLNAVLVTGSLRELRKARVVLDLVDSKDRFVIQTLSPVVTFEARDRDEFSKEYFPRASVVRTIPSNDQLARLICDMTIGTFADPPRRGRQARAIIDVHAGACVAIAPRDCLQKILAAVEFGPEPVAGWRGVDQQHAQADSGSAQTSTERYAVEAGTTRDRPSARPRAGEDAPLQSTAAKPRSPSVDLGISDAELSAQAKATLDSVAGPEAVTMEESPAIGERVSVSAVASDAESSIAQPPLQRTRLGESESASSIVVRTEPGPVDDADALSVEKTQKAGEGVPVLGPDGASNTKPSPAAVGSTTRPNGNLGVPAEADRPYRIAPLADGNDILQLDLPDKIDLIRLFDLVGEYLHLDYVYDPDKIKNEMVTLKLDGKRRGEIRVKELYSLLESVLNFKGYVMTRREGNLVAIAPVLDALQVDPPLVDPNDRMLEAGNIVVTRMYQLKHVDTLSAVNLLENMKLTVAVSAVHETQTLIITCYAYRMNRIESLLAVIDRPGRFRKVRFRELQYITANMLAEKVRALAAELETAGVAIALTPQTPSQSTGAQPATAQIDQYLARRGASGTAGLATASRQTVYLDADDRTNRILIIGYEEQLETVEELIDEFDVPQQAFRIYQAYELAQVDAREARDKLQELGVIGEAEPAQKAVMASPTPTPPTPFVIQASFLPGGPLVEEPSVVVLESTNSLLVGATREQHTQIAEIVSYVDRVQQDLRTLKVYDIGHIDAEEAREKLVELQLCAAAGGTSDSKQEAAAAGNAASGARPASSSPSPGPETAEMLPHALFGEPQVVVVDSTNSLLVNATVAQHAQIEMVLAYLDSPTLDEQIPYKVYQLENSPPSHLAEVLGRLIEDTVQDEEGKIEKVIKKQEEITIIPDPNTYSLIVYASKRNQEWISGLIQQLDKRRPQVLIDATLVEITKADDFSYDLSLLRSSDDLDSTSSITGVGTDPGASGRFIEWGSGALRAFYGDDEIQILLSAMQSESYGRVLAKPKLLVNDNEAGSIKTTDKTYVETKSGIPVSSGAVGNEQNFVETSIQYEPYEAGITLDITPHISEGDLLQLDIVLTRSDFLRADPDKPPDTRSNEVDTTVTLPDGSTIILGGLLKMNQVKSDSKVPILGDIPIVGGLFRSIDNEDSQNKLYVFVKAEIIRPAETEAQGLKDLERISERSRLEFEKHEDEFQSHENWPGIKPRPVNPPKVLDAQ
jgi:type II secretory pathway component GspD/PulD (secretin)